MKSYFLKELKYQFRKLWQRWSKALGQCSIALFISIGSILFWTTEAGQRLDIWVLQKFFEVRGTKPPPEDVIIVAIDDESYQKLEVSTRRPFPRIFVARALREIVDSNPKAIIIDANIPKEREDLEADQILEDALRRGPTTIWSGRTPQRANGNNNSNLPDVVTLSSETRFREAAKIELPMLLQSRNGIVSNLTLNKKDSSSLYDLVPISRPLVELAKIHIDIPGSNDLINFYGPKGTIKRISLFQFLGENVEAAKKQTKQKVVLFGFQSIVRERGQISKEEQYVSVSNETMFGVEIHANVVGNLIDNNWLKRNSTEIELIILYLTALLIAIIGIAFTPEIGIPLLLATIVLVFIGAYRAFAFGNFWLGGIGTLLMTALFTAFCNTVYHYVIIKGFKKYIEKTFKFKTEKEI